jgi:hypothetical protein
VDDDHPQLHSDQDGQEDLVLRAGAAVVAAFALVAAAAAATPSQLLAARMKANMQSYYDKAYPGLKITTVTCTIAKARTSAACKARFTWARQRAVGVFTIAAKIDPSTGSVTPRTTGASCKDSKTGAKLVCFR